MRTVTIGEAQARLSELVDAAAGGCDVVITRDDGRAVRLVPAGVHGTPRFGSARGLFIMADDFDAPLDDVSGYR